VSVENIPYIGEAFALATAVVWAFGVVMFRRSGETVHPVALNMFKNVLAVLLFVPTMWLLGDELLWQAPRADYLLLLASGVLGIGIADTLYFYCLNLIGASRTAIVACMYSPSMIAMSVMILGETLTPLQITGAVLVISAVLTAIEKKGGNKSGISRRDLLLGIMFGVLAVSSTAVSIVMIKPLLNDSPVLWVTMIRLVGGILFLAVYLALVRKRREIMASLLVSRGWKYTLAGSFFGTYLAMSVWIAGMKFTQVSTAAVLNQTSNLFVFIFAAFILKEEITRRKVVGIVMAVAGAILVSFNW